MMGAMSLAQTWRDQRERRFHPDRDAARDIIAELAARLPSLRYNDADASFVVTTYLDTRDGHYFQLADKANGARSLKLRIREYLWIGADGDVHYEDSCYLERKQREGDVRLKQRIPIRKRDVVGVVLGDRKLRDASPEAAAVRGEIESYKLRPALVSAYERRVFGDETQLRVTFDERVGFYAPPRGLYNMAPALTQDVLGSPLALGPSRILELKQSRGVPAPAWLEALLDSLTAAPGYSKFRDGMRAIQHADGKPRDLTRRITIPNDVC